MLHLSVDYMLVYIENLQKSIKHLKKLVVNLAGHRIQS